MGRLPLSISTGITPRISLPSHFLDNPVCEPFSVRFGSVIFKHELVDLFVFKDVGVESGTECPDPVSATNISEELSLLLRHFMLSIADSNRH